MPTGAADFLAHDASDRFSLIKRYTRVRARVTAYKQSRVRCVIGLRRDRLGAAHVRLNGSTP
jgi:hypothetical protein